MNNETWSAIGDEIVIRLSVDDWNGLLNMMGVAVGASIRQDDRDTAYRFIALINRMNKGNPNFRPYEIPEEFSYPTRQKA